MEYSSSYCPEVIREERELSEKFLLEPEIVLILVYHGGHGDSVLLFG